NVQEGIVPDGWDETLAPEVRRRLDVTRALNPAAANRIYRDRALTFMSADPLRAAVAMASNTLMFISPAQRDVIRGMTFGVEDAVSISYTLVCYALFALGAAACWRRVELRLILIAFAAMWIAHAVFVPSPRFRYPFDTLLTVGAGAGFAVLWARQLRVRRLAPRLGLLLRRGGDASSWRPATKSS